MDKVRGLGFRAKTQNPKQLKSVELNFNLYVSTHTWYIEGRWSNINLENLHISVLSYVDYH